MRLGVLLGCNWKICLNNHLAFSIELPSPFLSYLVMVRSTPYPLARFCTCGVGTIFRIICAAYWKFWFWSSIQTFRVAWGGFWESVLYAMLVVVMMGRTLRSLCCPEDLWNSLGIHCLLGVGFLRKEHRLALSLKTHPPCGTCSR